MAIFSSHVSLPEGIYHKSMDYGSISDIIDYCGYQYDIFHDNEQHWMIMVFFDRFLIPRNVARRVPTVSNLVFVNLQRYCLGLPEASQSPIH